MVDKTTRNTSSWWTGLISFFEARISSSLKGPELHTPLVLCDDASLKTTVWDCPIFEMPKLEQEAQGWGAVVSDMGRDADLSQYQPSPQFPTRDL
jgi:hypothetical protein